MITHFILHLLQSILQSIEYENMIALLDIVDRTLFQYSPETTLINIGATRVGLGAVYPMAKSRGFTTAGIVSSLALEDPESISEAVDFVCFIEDTQWGGKLPSSNELSRNRKRAAQT